MHLPNLRNANLFSFRGPGKVDAEEEEPQEPEPGAATRGFLAKQTQFWPFLEVGMATTFQTAAHFHSDEAVAKKTLLDPFIKACAHGISIDCNAF